MDTTNMTYEERILYAASNQLGDMEKKQGKEAFLVTLALGYYHPEAFAEIARALCAQPEVEGMARTAADGMLRFWDYNKRIALAPSQMEMVGELLRELRDEVGDDQLTEKFCQDALANIIHEQNLKPERADMIRTKVEEMLNGQR